MAWGSAAVAGVGIGAAGLAPALGTAGGLSLALGGAGAGAINTYVYNPDANFVEYAMGVGFGGLNPIGEAISVGGGVVGAGIAGARGGSARTGYQIGSTVTGLLGAGVDDYFRAVGKMIQAGGAVNRAAAARHAMAFGGASAGMGAAGAALGYQVGGVQGALMGAQIGGALAGFAVACFTAGTPLVVDLDGNSRPIDEIEVGDTVLARSEFDQSGPLELKRVEEKFVRTAVVMELVVRPAGRRLEAVGLRHEENTSRQGKTSGSFGRLEAGDWSREEGPSRSEVAWRSTAFEQAFAEFAHSEYSDVAVSATQSIKTTAEHPFYVPALGKFVPAGELQPGDLLISSADQLIEVVQANSTDEVTTVYNLRVADHHTYFVGGAIWGWDVWVHNAQYKYMSTNVSESLGNNMAGSAFGGQMMRTLGFEAAHIVPWDSLRAEPIRQLLMRNGFTLADIKFGPANGVWLPGTIIKQHWPAGTWHRGGSTLTPSTSKHSQDAMDEIYRRLIQFDGDPTNLRQELQRLGTDWQNGRWAL